MNNTSHVIANFLPKPWVRSPHIQSLVTSLFTKPLLAKPQLALLQKNSQELLIKTQSHGCLTANFHATASKKCLGVIVLLHGWEGSIESGYIVRTASYFIKHGFDVLRLNFRDHGSSHHLNHLPFNSVRLLEVEEAIRTALLQLNKQQFHLIGFSLGGNFALRLAQYYAGKSTANKAQQPIELLSVMSICPPIDTVQTSFDIENGPRLYHQYFVKRWHRSLKQKYRYYPELIRQVDDLYTDKTFQKKPSLNQMNAIFVPLHTPFNEVNHYLNAYQITQSTLNAIKQPCVIIYAEDDPIIKASQYASLNPTHWVTIAPQAYGGHCGFINSLKMDNWLDGVLLQLVKDIQQKNSESLA